MTGDHTVHEFLTFMLADQLFGVSVLQVNDVLSSQKITRAPLSSDAIAGIMTLRGRIVTAIDVRRCLGQAPRAEGQESMSVVIEQGGELFSLIIDAVGDVLTLSPDSLEKVPATLSPAWRSVASNIHKLQDKLLVILDVKQLLEMAKISPTETTG